jgi:hypothetical protein
MLYAHPIIMLCLVGLALYVLRLGYVRFAAVHLGRKGVFAWKRHVFLGRLAMAGLFGGLCGGLFMTWFFWSSPGATGAHFRVALAMLALMISGAATGWSLDRTRKPGNPLALVHGLGNALLALLGLVQVYTGYGVMKDFLW